MTSHWIIAAALAVGFAGGALAQDKVKLVDVIELSGAGASAGTNFKNGVDLAVADINAKGGILGKQIEIVHYDTQTNPGNTRAAVQRGIDEGAYALLGPVFSGPIAASMQIAQRAEIAQIVAAGAGADIEDQSAGGVRIASSAVRGAGTRVRWVFSIRATAGGAARSRGHGRQRDELQDARVRLLEGDAFVLGEVAVCAGVVGVLGHRGSRRRSWSA